jgi:glycosyltransferase involved in cell wall biosynthesis
MISVALCTYNGARFLHDQLESIAGQTLLPSEIVVSDDNSFDGTQAIVDEFEASLSQRGLPLVVRKLSNPRPLGVAKNFERAIEECRGDVIALCDQDDVWASEKMASIMGVFETHPNADLVFTNANLIGSNGEDTGQTLFETLRVPRNILIDPNQRWLPLLLRRNLVTGATVAFRANLARAAMPFPESWLHDEWLAMWAAMTGQIHALDENLVGYRQHGSNEIGVTNLTARVGVTKIFAPRRIRNSRLRARAASLLARVMAEPVISLSTRNIVSQKLAHEEMRSGLPSPQVRRVLPVIREAALGRYRKFGLGNMDALRDILQRDS